MKIEISKIDTGRYSVREDFDEEHRKQVMDSLEQDGQWNPIIVRQNDNGNYDLIAGHYRLQAAKELGWSEIEANVRDLTDKEADALSIKTNLVRRDMKPVEIGGVLTKMAQDYGLTQTDLSEITGLPRTSVNDYMSLSMELNDEVVKALEDDKISNILAYVIAEIKDKSKQPQFMQLLLNQNITQETAARKWKNRFLNDTIYTIGYQGRDWDDFVEALKNNEIDVLVDVRESTQSQHKPEFSGDVMEERLAEVDIEYRHIPELGVSWEIRKPYIEDWISDDCFEGWYQWSVRENQADFDLINFVEGLEQKGKPALMCMEQYHKPMRDQDHYCHRHFLAEIIRSVADTEDSGIVLPEPGETAEGRQLFTERIDL